MRTVVYILFCFNLLFVLSAYAQKEVLFRGDYLLMAATEVSNKEYRSFLEDVTGEIASLIPDTTVWNRKGSFNAPYVKYYFKHPAYDNYPVVGVTYEQAMAFCEWKEDQLNKLDTSKVVIVRLPTEDEWEYAASAGGDYPIYPWEGKDMIDKKGRARANFVRGKGDYMGLAGSSLGDNADITAPVNSYDPNKLGLYAMAGNVAEMVAEKGVAKGGSWNDRADELKMKARQLYVEPSAQIGFRYLVEVIDEKRVMDEKLKKRQLKKLFTKLNDSVCVSKTEVTNKLYKQFLNEKGEEFALDCHLWTNLFTYSNYYANNYRFFEDYPVVNVSKNDALAFCAWLENKFEAFFKKKVTVRLPSKDEYVLLYQKHALEGVNLRDKKSNYVVNFNAKGQLFDPMKSQAFDDLHDFDGYALTNPVKAFSPFNKVYGVVGNVSEMVGDENLVIGGNWLSSDTDLSYYRSQRVFGVDERSPLVGFRVVLVEKL